MSDVLGAILQSAGDPTGGQAAGNQAQSNILLQILARIVRALEGAGGGGSSTLAFLIVNADYVATANDVCIAVDASAAPVTITIPAAATVAGKFYRIKKVDATANAVTVVSPGCTLDGFPNRQLLGANQSFDAQSFGGTQWFLFG